MATQLRVPPAQDHRFLGQPVGLATLFTTELGAIQLLRHARHSGALPRSPDRRRWTRHEHRASGVDLRRLLSDGLVARRPRWLVVRPRVGSPQDCAHWRDRSLLPVATTCSPSRHPGQSGPGSPVSLSAQECSNPISPPWSEASTTKILTRVNAATGFSIYYGHQHRWIYRAVRLWLPGEQIGWHIGFGSCGRRE